MWFWFVVVTETILLTFSLCMLVNIVYAGKDQISPLTIIAIVVPISVIAVVLFVMGYHFLCSRARKKYNVVREENGKQ
jgi:hypothetical protein